MRRHDGRVVRRQAPENIGSDQELNVIAALSGR
jgi:hypothetical protein